jgi:hypothetical protein
MTKKAKADADDGLVKPGQTGKLQLEKREDEKVGRTLARVTLDPQTRNAVLAMSFGSQMFGDQLKPEIAESSAVLAEEIQRALKGDLSLASRIHTSQAISLDALFTEMARRSGNNMGQYPDAAERYMRLALKAQAACRSTLDALARLHQPREQTVKHVHVNQGGQAVVADHFHQHQGGSENGESVEQSHTTDPACASAALPSSDPLRDRLPGASREGKKAMPDARGDEPGST